MAVPISNSTKSVPNQYGIVKTQNIRLQTRLLCDGMCIVNTDIGSDKKEQALQKQIDK